MDKALYAFIYTGIYIYIQVIMAPVRKPHGPADASVKSDPNMQQDPSAHVYMYIGSDYNMGSFARVPRFETLQVLLAYALPRIPRTDPKTPP